MKVWLDRWKDFWRYKDLLKHLVARDIKLKYRRSVLGYLWSVLDPLLIMIVMTIVFSKMFRRNIENFPVYLFTGNMVFSFLRTSSTKAMSSIVNSASLIKKAYVPKYIFVLAKVCSSLVELMFTMAALVLVMAATKAGFSLYNLLFPIVLLPLFLFCLGFGLFLAQANVFFKDVQYIYNAVMTAWLYLSAVFYPAESLPDGVRFVVERLNPVYYYIRQARDLLYAGTFPEPFYLAAGWAAAIGMLCFGIWIFLKKQDRFILHL